MALTGWELWGSGFHGRHVAETYGLPYRGVDGQSRCPYRYYVGNLGRVASVAFAGHPRVKVWHWIGYASGQGPIPADVHLWADDEEIAAMLAVEHHRPVTVLRHQPRHWFREPLATGGRGVLLYCPGGAGSHDAGAELQSVIRRTGLEPIILGPPDAGRDISHVFRECSHYVRWIDGPDGWSHLAAEMVMAGRVVITNKMRPYQLQIHAHSEIPAVLDAVPHPAAPAAYRQMCDKRHVADALMRLMEGRPMD